MKTGRDVHEFGLYVSDCCLQELIFNRNESFSRCPQCSQLCEWELVDTVVSAQQIGDQNFDAHQRNACTW